MRAALLLPLLARVAAAFTHTFAHLPEEASIWHIHSPERALACHGLTPLSFTLTHTSAPYIAGEHACVRARFRTLFAREEHDLLLFAGPGRRRTHVLLARRGRPYLFAVFDTRLLAAGGHALRATTTRLTDTPPWDPHLTVPGDTAHVERLLRAHPFGRDEADADPNLAAYRRIALSLPAK